eukprot:3576473-Rhodomonas_salina.1
MTFQASPLSAYASLVAAVELSYAYLIASVVLTDRLLIVGPLTAAVLGSGSWALTFARVLPDMRSYKPKKRRIKEDESDVTALADCAAKSNAFSVHFVPGRWLF